MFSPFPRHFRASRRALACFFLPLAAASADLSVTAITDFLSDADTTIAKYDKNHDGKLGLAELGSSAWMIFAIDRNRDAALDAEEMRLGLAKLSRDLFPSKPGEPVDGSQIRLRRSSRRAGRCANR